MKTRSTKLFTFTIKGKNHKGEITFDSFLSKKEQDDVLNSILQFNLEWSNSQNLVDDNYLMEDLLDILFFKIRNTNITICKLIFWENETNYYTLKY